MDNEFTSYGYSGEPRWADFSIDDEIRAKKRFSRFFLAISIYLIVANVSALIVQVVLIIAMGVEDAYNLLSNYLFSWGMQVVCMYVLAFPVLYLIVRGMRKTVRHKTKLAASEFFILFLVAEGLMTVGSLVSNILSNAYYSIWGYPLTNSVSEMISDSPIWVIAVVAVIIGPIFEELIFRKLLMDKLGMYGDRIAIIVSAVAFGLFHGNLFQLFYATLLGALLAYVYSKTGNILYPIAIHMLTNLFGSVLAMPFIEIAEEISVMAEALLEGAEVDMGRYLGLTAAVGAYSLTQYGLAIAGIVILIRRFKRKEFFVSDRCEILIPKERRSAVIIRNVGAILFMVIVGIMMLISLVPSVPPEDVPIPNESLPGSAGEAMLALLCFL